MIVPHYYEDPHILHENTMPNRSYFIPASRCRDDLVEHRENSDRFQLLNGDWRFRYYHSIYDLQEPFYQPGYDLTDYDTTPVPGVWQNHGYDHHQYTNIRYPFPADPPYVPKDNPCGAYICDFVYHQDEIAPCSFLNFEGVASCFYVWLNGNYVGYSQVSHSSSEFDVTRLLHNGSNHLAVLVLKWCDGSYIIYAIIGLVVNTLSVFSVRELPESELVNTTNKDEIVKDEKYNLFEGIKLLAANKYYLMICITYILQQIYGAMIGMGTYYSIYIFKNENLFGVFSWAINIPLILALVFTPMLVAKWHGMYKLNVISYSLATFSRLLVAVAGFMGASGNIPLMLIFTAIAAFGQGPWQGDMNAVIAACSEYTWLTQHKRVDGTMYSCTSLGVKLGGGIGIAITGWLLSASHFDGSLAVQPDSCIAMLKIMYLILPFALDAIITILLSRMKVEEANEKLRQAAKIS